MIINFIILGWFMLYLLTILMTGICLVIEVKKDLSEDDCESKKMIGEKQ